MNDRENEKVLRGDGRHGSAGGKSMEEKTAPIKNDALTAGRTWVGNRRPLKVRPCFGGTWDPNISPSSGGFMPGSKREGGKDQSGVTRAVEAHVQLNRGTWEGRLNAT